MIAGVLSVIVGALGSIWVYSLEVALAIQRLERGFKRMEEEPGRGRGGTNLVSGGYDTSR